MSEFVVPLFPIGEKYVLRYDNRVSPQWQHKPGRRDRSSYDKIYKMGNEFEDQTGDDLLQRYRESLGLLEPFATQHNLSTILKGLPAQLELLLPFDSMAVLLYDRAQDKLTMRFQQPANDDAGPGIPETEVENSIRYWVWRMQEPVIAAGLGDEIRVPEYFSKAYENGLRSACILPLVARDRILGTLEFGSVGSSTYKTENREYYQRIADLTAAAIEKAVHFQEAGEAERELRLLLDVNNSVVSHLDLEELFKAIVDCLQRIIPHDAGNMTLYDAASGQLRVIALNSQLTGEGGQGEPGGLIPIDDTPAGLAFTERRTIEVSFSDLQKYTSPQVKRLITMGVRSGVLAPLIAHGRALGTIGLASMHDGAFSKSDVKLITQIASQISIAVDNALNFDRARRAELEIRRQLDRQRLMLEINNAVVSHLNLRELMDVISSCLREIIKPDVTGVSLFDPETNQLRAYVFDLSGNLPKIPEGTPIPMNGSLGGETFKLGKPIFLNQTELLTGTFDFERGLIEAGIRSGGAVPLIAHDRKLGILGVGRFRSDPFTADEQELLEHIGNQIAIAVENALAYREIETLKNQLTEEKLYLEEEINTASNFEEIIGSSPALKRILKQAETVAPTDSTVLIQGETGTGKELMARAIHSLSQRRERMLIKLNCAAIPTGLLESELFGHERGAFTGAIAQRVGRFELAHRGSFFLDEVGEIPQELQPKLLRVLQEQEFERLGSAKTQRVDVRLIAATNRDLAQMAAENKFRSDLYYRLNVFPITIPPLRERPEDIPLLARFFANKFAGRMKKQIKTIPADAIAALQRYHWPGNIREFENTIERAVILTQGADLQIPLPDINFPSKATVAVNAAAANAGQASTVDSASLRSVERDHILRVLGETDWVIGGPAGAAVRLGMKRTTLQARMRKLGITRSTRA